MSEPIQGPEPVAVVGIGLRMPGGNSDPRGLAEFLRGGGEGIVPVPRERWDNDRYTSDDERAWPRNKAEGGGFLDDIESFDARFFNISPREARYMDPQQRLVLETAWEALEHANIDPASTRRSRGGVYAGVSGVDYAFDASQLGEEQLVGDLAFGVTHFPVSGRLSYFLGWRGPSVSLDTACSSSLVALHYAASGLRLGECDIALALGVNVIHSPRTMVMFTDANMISQDGRCRTFDESADGYGRAEGAVAVVLKTLSAARRDGDEVLALVRSTAVGQDGDSAGLAVPNGLAQADTVREALRRGGVEPGDVQYVEAHGTGTPLGDPIELDALNRVFGDRPESDPLIVASHKTNVGHMEAAAGLGGVVKTVLQLRDATIYPHRNMTVPSTRIPWDRYRMEVPRAERPWEGREDRPRRAVVNSFGVTGTIAAAVIEEAGEPPAADPHDDDEARVVTASAKSAEALERLLGRFADRVESEDAPLDRVARASTLGRAHFRFRRAFVVDTTAELAAALRGERVDPAEAPTRPLEDLVWRFGPAPLPRTGLAGAAARLAERSTTFRSHLEGALAVLGTAGVDDSPGGRFAVAYAIGRTWQSAGVEPISAVAGTADELLAALCCAGALDLGDAAASLLAGSAQGCDVDDAVAAFDVIDARSGAALGPGALAAPGFWDDGPDQVSVPDGDANHVVDLGVVTDPTGTPDPLRALGRALASLYRSGAVLDWSAWQRRGPMSALPTYPFEPTRFWLPLPSTPAAVPAVPAAAVADDAVVATPVPQTGDAPVVDDVVLDALADILGYDSRTEVDRTATVLELGLDSVGAMDLEERVGESLLTEIPDGIVFDAASVDEFIRLVREELAA